ncbi:MAG: sulfur carrier protein ThiS [Rickettsiales bacterium]
MQIKVNGETRELPENSSVKALTEVLALNETQIAIERNREIVPRSRWDEVVLSDEDEIEIVRFIGGG